MALLSVLVDTLSNQLERDTPTAAIAINPFNANARLRGALLQLAESERDQSNLDDGVRQQVLNGLSFSPGDARLYSLLGMVARQANQKDLAENYFRHALKLSKTEQYALIQMFIHSIERNKLGEAIAYADTLLRRWPLRFTDLAPALIAIFAQPEGYQALMQRIKSSTTWRSKFIAMAAGTPEGLLPLNKALLELRRSDAPPTSQEINPVIRSLVARGDVASAYRLFLATLTDREKPRAGQIFNSRFTHAPTGKFFDWQIGESRGVEITLPYGNGGVLFQFQNRPVTQINFNQVTVLLPGAYRLQATVSMDELTAPRGLFLSVKCATGTQEQLLRLAIPTGTMLRHQISGEFEIPESECASQIIGIVSGMTTKTWSIRYGGNFILHALQLERPES